MKIALTMIAHELLDCINSKKITEGNGMLSIL